MQRVRAVGGDSIKPLNVLLYVEKNKQIRLAAGHYCLACFLSLKRVKTPELIKCKFPKLLSHCDNI